jgi:hypothetical protein
VPAAGPRVCWGRSAVMSCVMNVEHNIKLLSFTVSIADSKVWPGMYTFPSFLTAQVARSDVVRSLGPAHKKLRGNAWGARYEAQRSDYCDVCQRTFSDSLAGDPIHCTRRRGGDGSGRRCRFCLQEMLVRRGTRSAGALEGCSEDGRSWKAVILEGSEQRRQEWLRST